MDNQEFNMEEMHKKLQSAVEEVFTDEEVEFMRVAPDEISFEDDEKTAQGEEKSVSPAEDAGASPEEGDIFGENADEPVPENTEETTSENASENGAEPDEDIAAEQAENPAPEVPAEAADDGGTGEPAEDAAAAEAEKPGETAAAAGTDESGEIPEESAAAAETAESAETAAENDAGSPEENAEEVVAVTTEPLKAEKYEDIEAAKEEAARAAAAEKQAAAAKNEPDPAAVQAAYDREQLLARVMASQERAAQEAEQQALEEVKREKKRAKAARTARNLGLTFLLLAILAGIAGGAYFYMARYYATRFLTGTVINGKDVSGLTTAEVKQDLFSVADTYTLTIHERGGQTEELTSKQLGRSYIDNDQVETLMEEQENNKWLFHMNDEKVYEVTFDMAYDKKMAREAIDRLNCFVGPGITAPKDAKLSTDTDGTFIVTPEEQGNTLDEAKAKKLITDALDKAAPEVDFEAEDCYLKPEVYRDDEKLNKRANAWNAYLSVNVTYSFGNQTETINAETVRPYITDNGYDVYLATDWVKTLVYAWGQKYDTFGLERDFTTHDGVTIKIPAGGDYGWCINKEKTIEDVTECILNGVKGEREPVWLFKAMGWDNNDLTGTYCEVSIPDQHLWCYKDGVCVMDTDVVTGKPTPERMTFTGCYAIDGKKRDATLGRLDVQGYASPVSFWLPFNGGEGLHDAPWRSNFGGDIYRSNGSHGCVNIPLEKMETIFNALEIGNAVVVYDDKTPVTLKPDSQGE